LRRSPSISHHSTENSQQPTGNGRFSNATFFALIRRAVARHGRVWIIQGWQFAQFKDDAAEKTHAEAQSCAKEQSAKSVVFSAVKNGK
jgi:hypothetical protein